MSILTDLEYRILDEVYFVSSYETIFENTETDEASFFAALSGLLQKGWVIQMMYNEEKKDFEKLDRPDIPSMKQSSFVASKEGLLVHNSRN